MKKNILILLVFGLGNLSQAQITLIPDPEFELLLVQNGMDTDGEVNGQVATVDIEDETILTINYPQIQNITGIEDFASLRTLNLDVVNVTTIDISQNSNLEYLGINVVPLENLNLSNNLNLKGFNFDGGLACYPNCPYFSTITSLDLSNNQLLQSFTLTGSLISSVVLSQNLNLEMLRLWSNENLQQLNIKNDNNTNINYLFISSSNVNLNCLQVDDPAAVIAGVDPPYNNWIIENNPTIAEDCFLGMEGNRLNKITIYPNPVKDLLQIESPNAIERVTIYNTLGMELKKIATNFNEISLTGLPRGLLLVEIETEKGTIIEKIIKE